MLIDILPSVGLVAFWWHSGGDFTARGILMVENLDAMTSFLKHILYIQPCVSSSLIVQKIWLFYIYKQGPKEIISSFSLH